ncbi:MAG: hypothetical protein IT480_09060 [Gammaproteobacteria bacterium]|nr:hypothetical protein [Gammaproteobacteria bacterium]
MKPVQFALALLAGSLLAGAAAGETLVVNDQLTVREATGERPARGMRMSSVEARFGAPQSRHAAVGEPPITRWDYNGFAVFFEHDRVIHAVATAH